MSSKASIFVPLLTLLSALAYTQVGSAQPFNEPKWPQQFVASAGKPASFGFAVTQPGPISVSVQSAAPILVTLLGPLPNPIQRPGTGNVQLVYVAAPADVQRSYLWTVRIGSNAPQPVQGMIWVSHPPADMNLASRQLQLLQQRSAQYKARIGASQAAAIQAIAARQQAKQQARQQLAAAQALKTQQLLNLMRAPVTLTPPAPVAKTAPIAGTTATIRPGTLTNPMVGMPAQLSPVISSLSVGEGQPGDPVLITGSSFGSPGQVHFVVNPGIDLVAPVDRWTSTQILAHVPAAQGIQRYVGSVYVTVPPVGLTVQGSKLTSAGQQFIFDPQIDTLVLSVPQSFPYNTLGQPSYRCWDWVQCDPPCPPPGGYYDLIPQLCTESHGQGSDPAVTGDDVWNFTTWTQNGWTFESANVNVNAGFGGAVGYVGCGAAVPSCAGTDAYIVPTAPRFNAVKVHWSQAAFCNVNYWLTITVKGPLGTSPGPNICLASDAVANACVAN